METKGQAQDITRSAIPTHTSEFACIDFVNSVFSDYRGTSQEFDRLPSPEWQEWFLTRHGLEVRTRRPWPIQPLMVMRADLRHILERWANSGALSTRDIRTLNDWLGRPRLRQHVASGDAGLKVTVEPLRHDWAWVMASVAGSAAELMAGNHPERLKVCANGTCTWMFYDQTGNGSKRFCSITYCGNLVRVRTFRGRNRTKTF